MSAPTPNASPTPSPFWPALQGAGLRAPDGRCLWQDLSLQLGPGLWAVCGDEGCGKTALLRVLAGDLALTQGTRSGPWAAWQDLRLPEDDALRPDEVWQRLRTHHPSWDAELAQDLADALGLAPHRDKALFMLSTGTRRKVALVGLLASGAPVLALDQPYAALDRASVGVLREVLQEGAASPRHAVLVADHEPDPALPWRGVIRLGAEA